MSYDFDDAADAREDERREARADELHRRRGTACQCGGDMPGTCPGPANCPMCESFDCDEVGA